jgi:DNA-binding MarR family transcriptional regulator
VRITDPKAMRALAHPLRLDLLEVLAELGPATAAACARALGSTQANCSFHLRQLAKYGFVERGPESGDGREHVWQLTDLEQSWSSAEPDAATEQLERVFIQREADRMLHWAGAAAAEPEEWRKAPFLGGMTVPLTPDELRSVGERLRAVLQPYVERLENPATRPADARFVRVLLSATPLRIPPATEEDDDIGE